MVTFSLNKKVHFGFQCSTRCIETQGTDSFCQRGISNISTERRIWLKFPLPKRIHSGFQCIARFIDNWPTDFLCQRWISITSTTKMDFLIQWKCLTTRSTDKRHGSYSVETLNLIRLALDMLEIPPWQRESLVGLSMNRAMHWKPKWIFLGNVNFNQILLCLDMFEIPRWQKESVPCFSMHRVLHWKLKWIFLFNENCNQILLGRDMVKHP